MSLLTIKIEKIGLKDAGQCIDPYMTISVKGKNPVWLLAVVPLLLFRCLLQLYKVCFCLPVDLNGVDLNPVQDTPVATRKEDTYIHFSVDVEIQKHVEKLPKGNVSTLIQIVMLEI